MCGRHHTHVHDKRLIATVHPPDEDGSCVTWDLTPESYDHDLPTHLSAIHRSRAKKRALAQDQDRQRAHERALLDPWTNQPPDDVVAQWVDDWIAEAEDIEREDALRNAQLDDALATMLDEECSAQS